LHSSASDVDGQLAEIPSRVHGVFGSVSIIEGKSSADSRGPSVCFDFGIPARSRGAAALVDPLQFNRFTHNGNGLPGRR